MMQWFSLLQNNYHNVTVIITTQLQSARQEYKSSTSSDLQWCETLTIVLAQNKA